MGGGEWGGGGGLKGGGVEMGTTGRKAVKQIMIPNLQELTFFSLLQLIFHLALWFRLWLRQGTHICLLRAIAALVIGARYCQRLINPPRRLADTLTQRVRQGPGKRKRKMSPGLT